MSHVKGELLTARVKIAFQGESLDADDLSFERVKEEWSSYETEDGATVKLKHVVTKIYRLCDKKKDDGSPIYVLMGDIVLASDPPAVGSDGEGKIGASQE